MTATTVDLNPTLSYPPTPTVDCNWCANQATHLTIAPVGEIAHGESADDPRLTWVDVCPVHRRSISKRRDRRPWRPAFPKPKGTHS
jgi:hypothetical protein